eukprot:CAMPEP_0195513692 /NCGR_PEP_ID=MMETSP0794_2-20130614/5286_1 /TAXON_ID=515487 /ORGANISM="Stephanopyxis turris, Strain CCMP 815" /LENGTH=517 /DNA_ID=CAMNT_0040641769 /DNA_START=78 /DNA_END=1631 /DNA_ORIENTATION=-
MAPIGSLKMTRIFLGLFFCVKVTIGFSPAPRVWRSNLFEAPSVTPSMNRVPMISYGSPLMKNKMATSDDTVQENSSLSRRQFGTTAAGSLALFSSFLAARIRQPEDYSLWGILPVGPYKRKKTIRTTIVPGKMWTFDQKFGILNVQVPVRMTVVKLSTGGLFIYDAVAATPECISLLKELVKEHGDVKHIALGTVAIEHKVYAGVLAQNFANAKIWLQPGQYSFPVNLPDSFLGFPIERTSLIPSSMDDPAVPEEWKTDFEFTTLGPLISRDGSFGETAFYHKSTKTLLVTDTVVEVTDEVPAIFEDDPKPLLYHARDTITDVVEDTPDTRRKGWRRVILFGLYFTPSAIDIKDADVALKERRPDINPDFAGIYPWDWVGDDMASFKALQGGLLVAPILQKLILNRAPIEALDFADRVAQWPFERIIPAHLKNDLNYDGKSFRRAFSFLEAGGEPIGQPKPLDSDFKLLVDAEESLLESGAISKAPPLPGGKVSRAEILAQTAYGCRGGICAPKSSP